MPILSLDYGDRYIGLAITDSEEKIPLRHSVIDQKKVKALVKIPAIIQQEKINKILVGVPISLSGNETAQTRKSRKFINRLRKNINATIQIEEVDETLTSVEAAQNLRLEGSHQDEEHMEAARLILEAYLKKQVSTE